MSNLIKRTVPVILALVLCLTCLVAPVSAESTDSSSHSGLINLMDYNDSFIVNQETYTHYLSFPTSGSFKYFEGIIYATRDFDLTIRNWAASEEVNVSYIGDDLYRFYVDFASSGSGVYFDFTSLSGKAQFSILSCFYSRVSYSGYSIGGEFNGYNSTLYELFEGTYDGVNPVAIPAYSIESGIRYATEPFSLYIYPDVVSGNWKKWDKISIRLNLFCNNITSISASVDGVNCLDYLSFVDTNNTYTLVKYVDEANLYLHSIESTKYIELVLDLTSINKNTDSYPIITITGDYFADSSSRFGYFNESYGYIVDSNINPIIFYFRKLIANLSTWFSDLIDKVSSLAQGSTQDQTNAGDFNTSVNEQASQFEDMTDAMESVTRPEPEDVDIDFSQYVSQSDISGITSPLQALFSGDIFGVVLILSVMMGTVSFVFYGKR